MDQSKVDMFLAVNAKKFTLYHLEQIKQIVGNTSESKFQIALSLDYKDPTTMMLISIFAGSLGVDRFMLGETGLGVAKLLTAGGCGFWTIIDWFTIIDRTKDHNFRLFMQTIA